MLILNSLVSDFNPIAGGGLSDYIMRLHYRSILQPNALLRVDVTLSYRIAGRLPELLVCGVCDGHANIRLQYSPEDPGMRGLICPFWPQFCDRAVLSFLY